jgi:hypothetical protein
MVDEGIQLTLENLRCVARERFFSALFQHLEHIAAQGVEYYCIALRERENSSFDFESQGFVEDKGNYLRCGFLLFILYMAFSHKGKI